jgi:hypothetical protein
MKGILMKSRTAQSLLGIYDLILAAGAVYIGSLMIQSSKGAFAEYPREWLSKLPFDDWAIPGMIIIVLFGAGNVSAAIINFRSSKGRSWVPSAVLGAILLSGMIIFTVILGKWYLATVEFVIIGAIQLYLSLYSRHLHIKSDAA